MKFENLYIAGTGSWLPDRVSAEAAVQAGIYDPEEHEKARLTAVTEAVDISAVEMAVRAGRMALERSGIDPAEIDLVLHATIMHQGLDFWSASSYVARNTVPHGVPAIEIRQMSNGGLAALEFAAAHLTARPERRSALLTTGDCFTQPSFDRWGSDKGLAYGDGGTAAVLTRRPSGLRLLSLATHSDPTMEQMHRGDEPFLTHSCQNGVIDVKSRKMSYINQLGMQQVVELLQRSSGRPVQQALAEAGAQVSDVRHWVVPHGGRHMLQAQYLDPLGIDIEQTNWEWASTVGHLGPGDQFTSLHWLEEKKVLAPGDLVALVGTGGGFTWSAAVLEVCEPVEEYVR